jgi:iron complex outermembrane receptor protein
VLVARSRRRADPLARTRARGRVAAAIAGALAWTLAAAAAALAAEPSPEELAEMDLAELARIEVRSVSRRPERLSETAAAVTVIRADDIRRTGATSLPEALRLAPGVFVGRVRGGAFVVGSRGTLGLGLEANKLLAQMDGRALYHPSFAGVSWLRHDTFHEDIDRIEVTRGPGSSVWGANAVNGVVNIVTKAAKETQGTHAAGGVGFLDETHVPLVGFARARHGFRAADGVHIRAYGLVVHDGPMATLDGGDGHDALRRVQGGFRADIEASDADLLTIQGDVYRTVEGAITTVVEGTAPFVRTVDDPSEYEGGNLLGRWTRELGESSEVSIQAYWDAFTEDDPEGPPILRDERVDIFDLDAQHTFEPWEPLTLTYGVGYRVVADTTARRPFIRERHRTVDVPSAFVQAEARLIPDVLAVTLGTKLEHNDYTGFTVQPTARFALTPAEGHALWGAATRAVRTPSRFEHDIRIDQAVFTTPTALVAGIAGDGRQRAEELLAFEGGYRLLVAKSLSLELAGFLNLYDDLRTLEPDEVPAPDPAYPGFLFLPIRVRSLARARTWGGEASLSWQALDELRLTATYSHLRIDADPGRSRDPTAEVIEGTSPRHVAALRSSLTLLEGALEADILLRYVDHLPALDIHSYVALDARLGFSPVPGLTLAVVGQNLLDPLHPEAAGFGSTLGLTQVPRRVYASVSIRF